MDQSADFRTEQLVSAICADDPRVQYHRTQAHGKTTALNRGIALAQGTILAFTDDDCEVSPTWLHDIARTFEADPRLMLLVGAVIAAEHNPTQGFVPTFEPMRVVQGLKVLLTSENPMGANLAMRAVLPHAIGPFDPVLGAGAPLHASYDVAYCYYTYRMGRRLRADPSIVVVHHGFRTWEQGRQLVRGYAIGTAAAYTKFIRLGDPLAAVLLLVDIGRYAARLIVQVTRGRRPVHLAALLFRFVGIAASFRYPIDPAKRIYVLPCQAVDGSNWS